MLPIYCASVCHVNPDCTPKTKQKVKSLQVPILINTNVHLDSPKEHQLGPYIGLLMLLTFTYFLHD